MKKYKRHLMFGHQPARPETIEYQYFGTRWKSIQHQVKIKRFKLRYNLFVQGVKSHGSPLPLLSLSLTNWQATSQSRGKDNTWGEIFKYGLVWCMDFQFWSSFLHLNILFSFVIHKREDEGDWTKVTLLVVNLPKIVMFKNSWEGKHSFWSPSHNCD